MKIGIITDALDDRAAGIGTYVRNLIINLNKIDKKNKYYLIHYKKNSGEVVYKNANHIIVPMKQAPLYRTLRKLFILPKQLRKAQLDVVHDPGQIGPFFRKNHFKTIMTIHDLVPLLYPKTHNWVTVFHHTTVMPWVIKFTDAIIGVSENTKKDIGRFYGKAALAKTTVTLEGVDSGFKVLNKSKSKQVAQQYGLQGEFILSVATLEPRKNLDTLLKAFARIKRADVQLALVGKTGWKYASLFKLVKKLGIEKKVVFTGFVKDHDLPYLYNAATMLVYPSLYEGFGLPVLEAMACGCPVITSNIPSLREAAGDAALTISPRNSTLLAQQMQVVLKSKVLQQRLRKKGLSHVKNFSWKTMALKTKTLYEQ